MIKVAAAIIISRGRILIARRGKGQSHEGLWEFPGGKVEPDENPQQCLERELLEELGLKVQAGRVLGESIDRSDHGSFKILAVTARILEGELLPSVHDRVEWTDLNDLEGFDLLPADRELWNNIKSYVLLNLL